MTAQDLEDRLIHVKTLVREVGTALRESAQGGKHVRHKSRTDLVTEYDLIVQQALTTGLHEKFARDRIVGEEGPATTSSGPYWLIDPIDGTTNFVHGVPEFTLSAAFLQNGKPSLGVVYDPNRDELYHAMRGEGAWLGERRLAVTRTASLESALLSANFPYDARPGAAGNFPQWQSIYLASRGVRHFGCASLSCAFVAAGRVDGHWELHARPWDLAAGVVLIEEAGGRITRLDGTDDPLSDPCAILATNGALHEEILGRLAEIMI
jgi:myo-inositol-1(or 4)-monophosphatase